jgi:FGGY-family pentulose kinase
MKNDHYFIGVDVGSFSVRAAIFSNAGVMLAQSVSPIDVYQYPGEIVEQSSDNIWNNAQKVIRQCIKGSGVDSDLIKGIAFDATCSLVVLDEQDQPVTVSSTGENDKNIIMWMDHRAIKEADFINETKNKVLDYVGGTISPEMQIPKILWLKNYLPDTYSRTKKFFDLADFLVYKACGNDVRSVCTQVCKWTYLAHERSWSKDFFDQIHLDDVFDHDRLGNAIEDLAKSAGTLRKDVAVSLGLKEDVVVAVGIIDAHAGGVGLLGGEPETTLAIIGGTSSCHMAVSKDPLFVEGIWGPYFGAMIPGMWLNEGGQSAAGSLIDHIIQDSACYSGLRREAESSGKSVYQLLNEEVLLLEEKQKYLTQEIHLLGYFYGNRSPRANPHLRGMISGLTLNRDKSFLARVYLSAIQSLAYGTRHIIETLNHGGHKIGKIKICGGGIKNTIFLREHADITGCDIVLPGESEAVLLGSAMCAATASGQFSSLTDAMKAMSSVAETIKPREAMKKFHDKKYHVFHEMHLDQLKYKQMVSINVKAEPAIV